MTDLVAACKSDSLVQVEMALSDPTNIDGVFLDKNGNELTPISWACNKGIISFIEMMVKKGANPNVSFIQSDGTEISVIDWVISQGNGSLAEELLKYGAIITPYSFQIAHTKASKTVIYAISDKTQETFKKMYKSHNYIAFENNLIDFSTDILYIFAFNVGQANFIVTRRHDKIVLFDAGNDSGEVVESFRNINKDYLKFIGELEKLKTEVIKFGKNPGKVNKIFTTSKRSDPVDQFKIVEDSAKKAGNQKQIDLVASLKDSRVNKKSEVPRIIQSILKTIDDIIKNYEDLEDERQRHEINLVFKDAQVEHVFITHPHTDHISFLTELSDNFKESFQGTKYLFGGIKDDWKGKTIQKIFNYIGQDKIEYLGRNYESIEYKYLDGLDIKIWGQENPENLSDINQISFITTIYFNNRGLMFTGDANGCNLQRLKIDRHDTELNPEIKKLLGEIGEIINNCRKSKTNSTDSVFQKLKEFKENNKCDVNLEKRIHQMLGLEEVVLIFEPHHGSVTKNSHDIYQYFSAQDPKKVFCISSHPNGNDCLPREESFVGRVKEPKVKEHPVVYATSDKIPTMNVTTDPVYTTGSCCDGMYVFSLSPDGNLSILDLTEETPQWEKINIDYSSMNTNNDSMNTNKDSMNTNKDSMNTSNDSMNISNNSMNN